MPRSLVLGNGNILVCLDKFGQVRDFYFPYVGLENHTANCVHKIGVSAGTEFSWIDDGSWDVDINYAEEALVSKIKATSEKLEIEITFRDTVYNEQNILIRKIEVKNLSSAPRTIKVFLNQQFQISGVSHGNTAYFDPDMDSIIHYKGSRVFLVGGQNNGRPFTEYSIGAFNIEGKEGTWRDAEDRNLSKNAVEHGSVDSTIAFTERIPGGKKFNFDYWIIAGFNVSTVKSLQNYIHTRKTSHIIDTTENFWKAWVNKININFANLNPDIVKLFKMSLLIMRTHVDNRGSIIASGDSDILQGGRDTYSYMWPRDAAFVVLALDRAGYFEDTQRFFKFCNEVIGEEGYLLHKYQPDKSVGSSWHPWIHNGKRQLAIQEDETALVIYALWQHYAKHRNLEFIEEIYNSFIKKTADFIYFYRDENTKLPFGSYDLWEENFATSTFTASAVYGALVAASNFAKVLGKENDSLKYLKAAQGTREAIVKYLYRADRDFFCKSVDLREKEPVYNCSFDVSSFYGPFKFGILARGDERLKKAYETLEKQLCCRADLRSAKIGGVLRYENDTYQLRDPSISGNPWFITTLWATQYKIDQAKRIQDLEEVNIELKWVTERALKSGILSEQLDPNTSEQISVAPLIWSHAELVTTVFDYLSKLREIEGD